jgi:hypothetical protein
MRFFQGLFWAILISGALWYMLLAVAMVDSGQVPEPSYRPPVCDEWVAVKGSFIMVCEQ